MERRRRQPELPEHTAGKDCEREPWLKQIIIFYGPEGSGKSTQAKLFSEKYDLPLIDVGNELRKIRDDESRKDEIAQTVRDVISKGFLQTSTLHTILAPLLEDKINGVVLDGVMRTGEQTQRFDELLKLSKLDSLPVAVVSVNVSQEESWRRLEARRRQDDTPKDIDRRLNNFYKDNSMKRRIISERFNLIDVNGEQSILNVQRDVERETKHAWEKQNRQTLPNFNSC